MSKYLEPSDIIKAYERVYEEALQAARMKNDEIERRSKHYREIDFNTAMKEVEEEVNARNISEDEKRAQMPSALKDASDEFFIFNNCTDDQISKYIKLAQDYMLQIHFRQAMFIAIEEAMKENDAKSHLFYKDGEPTKNMISVVNDASKVANANRIGVIERVQISDERQQNRRFQIIEAIRDRFNNQPIIESVGIGALSGALAGTIAGLAESPLVSAIFGALFIEAAIYTILGSRDLSAAYNEAKESGLYNTLIKFEEAKRSYLDYFEKMGADYGLEEFEGSHRINNGL